MLPNPEIREVTVWDYLRIVKKNLKLIGTILFIIPTFVTISVFTTKPVYRATASILAEKNPPKVTKFEEVYPSGRYETASPQYYQTQLKILGSSKLADSVVAELNLGKDREYKDLRDPGKRVQGQISLELLRNSQIILVNVDDTDALRASSIANALSKAYIKQDIETRNQAAKEAAGWLEVQLVSIRKRMQESEVALNKYIQDNRIVAVPDIEKKTESLLENLKKEKTKLEKDLAENLKRYKEKHPKIISLRAQLDETAKKVEQETNNLLELNQKLVQYNLLKKESESNQELYTSILKRAKEADVSEKIEASSIRIIDYAKPPSAPFKPKKGQSIMMALIMSLFFGVAVSFFLEYLDSSIRTADDVRIYLDMPFLGYIPSADKEAKSTFDKTLVCFKNPSSTITEAYRTVRTAVLFASPEDRPLKTILITSSLPQEGKSFVSSNLASVFAQINERIVLIDVDMRRPTLHKGFKVNQDGGLSNYLTGNVNLDSVIKQSPVDKLSLITSGTIPPNPSELLTSAKTRLILEELKSKFDRIILDSPPILSVADTSLLANLVDGVVLVIKGGSTRLDAIMRSKEKIVEAKGKIIGVIINNIEVEKEDYYYYNYYNYSGDKGGSGTAKKPQQT